MNDPPTATANHAGTPHQIARGEIGSQRQYQGTAMRNNPTNSQPARSRWNREGRPRAAKGRGFASVEIITFQKSPHARRRA